VAAADLNIDPYIDALVVLGTAGVVIPFVRRVGGSPVIGYLAAGAILGPLGLGALKGELPFLRWLTVTDAANVAGIAELGVVFLLFLIGLELSFERLATMRRLVFGLGGAQVTITTAVLTGLIAAFGASADVALVVGFCLALSSTAIVLEVLASRRRLSTSTGRATFAVLLAQDLAVVPLILLIAVLGSAGDGGSVLAGLATALLKAVMALLVIVAAGRFLLRPLLRLVATSGTPELFIAATLFVVVGSGVAAGIAGLSMALGAFVAGLMLAETEYRKAIETIIEPFKALLLGVFFFTIGMRIDVREVVANPHTVAAAVAGLVALKAAIAYGLMRVFRLGHAAAMEASLVLGPGGEFAFVGVALALGVGLVPPATASFVLVVTAIGMGLIPWLETVGRQVQPVDKPHVEPPPEDGTDHAIIVGYGRFGKLVGEMLRRHELTFLATDSDPTAVALARRRGEAVYFGNATDMAYLESCGLARARALILTIHDQRATETIVRQVRERHPDLTIVARARDADHARHLYALGVTDAVPETIEASLQLSEAVLVGLGRAAGPVIASIHEKRDEFRHELQQAAQQAGQAGTRSIRAREPR
jgi:CPA2 family monovalent cation:H+ antiporter-2